MDPTESKLESVIKAFSLKLDIQKYELDISRINSEDNGFFGNIYFVKMVAIDNGIRGNMYDLVIKLPNDGEQLRKQTSVEDLYQREIFMYDHVFPKLRELQEEHLQTNLLKVCECYFTKNTVLNESLVLENLQSEGFEVHNKQTAHNLNHVLFVLKNFGKFHALSFAMKILYPDVFKTVAEKMKGTKIDFIRKSNFEFPLQKDFEEAVSVVSDDLSSEMLEKLEYLRINAKEILTHNETNNYDDVVIALGDCWNNNLMFKYENNHKQTPVDLRFLDFQFSFVGSPISDLAYYLYTSTDKEILDQFDALLNEYYSSLSHHLSLFNINIQQYFNVDYLKHQWKIHGKFAVILSTRVIKLLLCKPDEKFDYSKAAEIGDLVNNLGIKVCNPKYYKKRVKNIFEHWISKFS